MEGLYYAVSGGKEVFRSKEEALMLWKQLSKTNKTARFKSFAREDEASAFASVLDVVDGGGGADGTQGQGSAAESDPGACTYPKLKVPALNAFRLAMEKDDMAKVKGLVEENPRYLIECSADLPVLLQKGCHYNALHVCARQNRSSMARFVLDTITSSGFWRRTYPKDTDDVMDQRRNHLLDLYLHSLDKGRGYTPLHFASEMGHPDVLEVLLSCPSADLKVVSRDGKSIGQLLCERYSGGEKGKEQVKAAILELLEGQFYVPILRSEEDDTSPAILGKPFSPSHGGSPLGSVETTPVRASLGSPLTLNAIAGPMSPSRAKEFYSSMKRPRDLSDRQARSALLRSDGGRGLERLGRDLARRCGINWQERWSFLNEECNFATDAGLEKLESYFARRETDLEVVRGHRQPTTPTSSAADSTHLEVVRSHSPPTTPTFSAADSSAAFHTPGSDSAVQLSPSESSSGVSFAAADSVDCADGQLEGLAAHLANTSLSDSMITHAPVASVSRASTSETSCDSPASSVNSWPAEIPPFICGFEPSKDDQDVLLAIGSMAIDPDRFPHVVEWHHRANDFSPDVRQRWKTPAKIRSHARHFDASPAASPLSTLTYSPHSRRTLPLGAASPRLAPSPAAAASSRPPTFRERLAVSGGGMASPSLCLDKKLAAIDSPG